VPAIRRADHAWGTDADRDRAGLGRRARIWSKSSPRAGWERRTSAI
jgi:hypothetical protein